MGCPSPDRANQVLLALTRFTNLLAAGHLPPAIRRYLCGATLLTSRKKGGGHHPIAVGEVLCRLTSKCLSTTARRAALDSLVPSQLGVGVEGGCEAIIHATSHLLTSSSNPSCR